LPTPRWRELSLAFLARSASSAISFGRSSLLIAASMHDADVAAVVIVAEV
jgi:hypothetical protein